MHESTHTGSVRPMQCEAAAGCNSARLFDHEELDGGSHPIQMDLAFLAGVESEWKRLGSVSFWHCYRSLLKRRSLVSENCGITRLYRARRPRDESAERFLVSGHNQCGRPFVPQCTCPGESFAVLYLWCDVAVMLRSAVSRMALVIVVRWPVVHSLRASFA